MFTGLVEEVGEVVRIEERPQGRRFTFSARRVLEGIRTGDSIAVSGCCLTAVDSDGEAFSVEAVPETLARTTLGEWRPGDRVNLERSLRLDDRLGGHLVQGHVDGVGRVTAVTPEGEGRRITVSFPDALAAFIAEKGSIAIDGTSLTVAGCGPSTCEVALVPHTLEHTISNDYEPGSRVNLEVDLVARYLARFLETGARFGGHS